MLDDQRGADGEGGHLQGLADGFGDGRDEAAAFRRPFLKPERLVVLLLPGHRQVLVQAHGVDHLGIAHQRFGRPGRRHRGLAGGADLALRQRFVEAGQGEQQQGAGDRGMTEQRVDQVDRRNIDGHPGGIEQRQHPRPGQPRADQAEIAQRLGPVGQVGQGGLETAGEGLRCQMRLEPGAEAAEHAGADGIERRHHAERSQGDHAQQDQGLCAATGQDAVVDLHHVERRGEHQDIDAQAEQSDGEELPPAAQKGVPDHGGPV